MNVAASPPPPPLSVSGDPHGQDAGGPFTQKVGRYSAEERKEKIERYRTKRNQRNFHKKITVMISRATQSANAIPMYTCPLMHLLLQSGPLQYACRKTLADSRPRVQGRFARNAETEAEAVAGHEREASDNNSYEHCHYGDLTTNSSSSSCCYDIQCRESGKTTTFDDGKWWWETPVAAPAAANGHHGHRQYQQQLLDFDIDMDMDGDDLWASLADMCSGT